MTRKFAVNRKIQQFIERSDKKPSAVADRAGIRRDVFSRIIHCRRPVYADEVVPIAAAMGVTLEYLFNDCSESGEVHPPEGVRV